MSKAQPDDRGGEGRAYDLAAKTLVQERLRSLRRAVTRRIDLDDIVLRPTSPASRRHLFEEATELYWNEMNWEQLTEEEMCEEDELTEMVFPGLLALVDAFLPRSENGEPDRDREHRDVAHDFLTWLARRLVELRDTRPDDEAERKRVGRERKITDDLIDLIMFRLHSLTDDEVAGLG
ncbi:MAG: hypothetical protein ACE5HF_08335 [Gemmatimonadota bacterium]